MSFFDTQNPGIGGIDELTPSEEVFLMNLSGLPYISGDIIYYNGSALTNTPWPRLLNKSKTFTYNVDGSLNVVTDSAGTKTMAYSGGVLQTVTGTGIYPNKSFSYNVDGSLASVTVS